MINTLKEILKGGLPGESAQLELAPYRKNILEYDTSKARKAAVMLLLYYENNTLFFPLIKRPSYNGHHSNQISLPGGKLELGESLEDAALRETEEELGIQSRKMEVIGNLSPLFIPPSNFLVHPYIAFLNEPPKFIPDPIEVQEIITTPVTDLSNPFIVKEKYIEHSNQVKMKTKYFAIENEIVWGATAMILSEFRHLLKQV